MEDLLSHCQRNAMLHPSVSQGHTLCGDFCHLNVPCTPLVNFERFNSVMQEYFQMKHAESIPTADLNKSPQNVFYLLMHAVRKESSTTTKLRAVFDASAKSSSNISLNDILLVGLCPASWFLRCLLSRLCRSCLLTRSGQT